jgi:hypothetical protein
MIADAKVLAEGLPTGSMQAKLHIPQQPMRYTSDPLKPECLPAEYASKCITRNGASIGKLYTSLEDLLQVEFDRAQPRHARHMCFTYAYMPGQ